MQNFSIPFVLTKFGNFINDAMSKLENDGFDPNDFDLLLQSVQAGVNHFKKEINEAFVNPKIFLFDPNVDTWIVNQDLEVKFDPDMEETDPSFYRVFTPLERLRDHIKQ